MSAAELWNSYRRAVERGDVKQADAILRKIHSYKGNPPPRPGGCAKCRKRLY